MFKSQFERMYTQSQIQRSYLQSKIEANPHNYTISDRMIFTDSLVKYAIGYKRFGAEEKLSEFLDYDCSVWAKNLLVGRDFGVDMAKASDCASASSNINPWLYHRGAFGTMIKYNNLMVEEEILLNTFTYLDPTTSCIAHTDSTVKTIYDGGYLTAYVTLFLACTAKESIIPYLFYINTKQNTDSLEDLINMKYVEECFADAIAPILTNIKDDHGPINFTASYLDTVAVPLNRKAISVAVPNIKFQLNDEYPSLAENGKEYLDLKYKLGLVYTLAYGCEVLYQYTLLNERTKEVLEALFSVGYVDKSFINHLYSFNSVGDFELNPKLTECFDSVNSVRFKNIIDYVWNVVDTDTVLNKFKCKVPAHEEYFGIPYIFSNIIPDCHQHAVQKIRVDTLSLLYLKAVESGFNESTDSDLDYDDLGIADIAKSLGIKSGMSGESEDSDLMDLDIKNKYSSKMQHEDSDDITKDSDMPSLDSLENLRTNLENSKYEYNVNHCTSIHTGYEKSYKDIADNVMMLSHALTKKIREIKTYNTGGKQPGANKGKLDRKNICHYKTSHNIFYNNDYKVKEMDLAFGIILDMSGSMHGSGIKDGKIVMILLHEVLNALRINHSIIGHDSDDRLQSNIYKYYYFNEEKEHSLKRPYNLMGIEAKCGNCDSGALYYMQQLMHNVRNKDKICLIFSDGAPTECTGSELREQVRSMEREGIHVIGIGINFNSIKDYYSDYANGKNLKEMLDIVVNILTRYVLEKKD